MSNNKKDKKRTKDSSGFKELSIITLVKNNAAYLFGVLAAVFAVTIFIYTSASKPTIKNYINSEYNTLKDAIFSTSEPHLFYCIKEPKQKEHPSLFKDLFASRSSKFTFAALNCSQTLPSGKTLWERFKLKREIKPVIFGSAPWTQVKQAQSDHLKNLETLKKFADNYFLPKATLVTTDKELRKHCGIGRNTTSISRPRDSIAENIDDTCIVFIKGARHSKTHSDIEARLVKENPKLKVVIADGSKKRLSFENPDEMSADMFALRVHAIRNMTHYITMVNPITWDYLSTFVAHSAGSPIESYSGSKGNPFSLLKLSSPVFKRKSQQSKSKVSFDDNENDADDTSQKSSTKKHAKAESDYDEDDRSKEGRARRRQKARDDHDQAKARRSGANEDESSSDKAERDRIRRENMDHQSRERVYDNDERFEEDDESDESEIIEL